MPIYLKGRGIVTKRNEALDRIQPALSRFVQELQTIYGTSLKSVILFGSYARNEARTDSDIDVLLLLDMTEEEIRKKRSQLSELRFEMDKTEPLLDIQPVTVPLARFQHWKDIHPFYRNIVKEGVPLYEAA